MKLFVCNCCPAKEKYKEVELINQFKSNNPAIGYNQ